MSSRHLIYCLVDPSDGEVRYVGRSSSGTWRPRSYWRAARHRDRDDHTHRWVRAVLASGREPLFLVLETFLPADDIHETLDSAEVAWVRRMRLVGCELTNATEGGTTGRRVGPMPPETIERIRAALRGVPKSESHRLALSEAKRGTPKSARWSAAISRRQLGRERPGHGELARRKLVGRVVGVDERQRAELGRRRLMRPVLCVDLLLVFESIAAAARHLGLSHAAVSGACHRGVLAGGHEFVFVRVVSREA